MDIFAYATRTKLRFETDRGNLTVEDLWDLPLTDENGGLSIDSIGRIMTKAVRDNEGNEAFVSTKEKDDEGLPLKVKLQILEHIRDHKVEYAARAEKAVLTKARKQKILEIIEQKKVGALEEKSVEELQELLDSM